MRQFYLINGNGARYSLTDVEHWLYKPDNLGAKFSSKYTQLGGNFIRTSRITKPDDIKGTILFTGKNQYDDYTEFVKFLAVEPLTLVYITNDEYRVSVDVKSLDKGEIQNGILKCEIRFKRLSRWYKAVSIINQKPEGSGKLYNYRYSFKYVEYEPQTVTIESDSGYDCPTRITIFGPATNPNWKQYLNGDVVATGKVNASVREGRRIVIDCMTIPYSIKEFDNANNVKSDLYQYSDFTTQRFINLGFGKNRITVEHDGTNVLDLAVESRIEYETV